MAKKEKLINEGEKENTQKSTKRNMVKLFIVIGITLLVIVSLLAVQKKYIPKGETVVSNNTNLSEVQNVQNKQEDDKAGVHKEQELDKQCEKEEKKEETIDKNANITTESQQPQKEENKQDKLDFDEVADKIFEELGVKGEIDKLPLITEEERPKYEKMWDDMLEEKNNEFVQVIKTKYPSLSDDQAQEYITKVFGLEYVKEAGLRIAKHSEQIIGDARDAIEKADRANALSDMTTKYVEILINHGQISSREYKVNEADLKILQQYVMEKSDGKYTVIIKEDKTGYDVEKTSN